MKLRTFFAKTGDGILAALIHAVYFIWNGAVHVLYRPKVTYQDEAVREKLKRPCILIANHTSHNDGSFVPQVLWRKKIYVLVTTKWYNKKLLRVFFSHLRYIPIDLAEMDNSWLEKAQDVIKRGSSVLIFPEGRLSKDGSLGEFHPGFLMLARFTDVPVIPLAITGGYKKFHRQRITVGSEITFDVHAKGRPSVILKEGARICREQVESMLTGMNEQ